MVRRVGPVDSATPLLRPGGGRAPRLAKSSTALHFPHPCPFWIPAFAGMTIRKIDGIPRHNRSGVGAFSYQSLMPGSGSRTCLHSNRLCRLGPAHQGMKSWCCGLVRRVGPADSATPQPDPSGGQAPALHWLRGNLEECSSWRVRGPRCRRPSPPARAQRGTSPRPTFFRGPRDAN